MTAYDGDEPPEQTAPTAPSPARAPSPAEAPSPPVAPSPVRYTYLVGRLRNRLITMEEATELFDIQNQMILRAREAASSARTTTAAATRRTAPSPGGATPAARPAGLMGEDALWETLPVAAAAAGILAAVVKRAQGGPLPSREASSDRPRPKPPTDTSPPPQ